MRRTATTLVLFALVGCAEPHVPGAPVVDALRMRVRMLPDPGILDSGGFVVRFRQDGDTVGTPASHRLNYVGVRNRLVWADESAPADLPTSGDVEVELVGIAPDAASTPLGVGGVSEVVRVVEDGPTDLPVLVSRWREAVLHPARLRSARAGHRGAIDSGRLIVVGGRSTSGGDAAPAVGIVDLFTDQRCDSDDDEGLCAFETAPPGRWDHVLVPLWPHFRDDCPLRNNLLFGLGRTAGDETLADLWLLDADRLGEPDALTLLDAAVTARRGASVAATSDCRVLIMGGTSTDGGPPIGEVDVLTFNASGVTVSASPGPANPAIGSAVARFPNLGTDDVITIGGTDALGASTSSALVSPGSTLEFCNLDRDAAACNGAESPLGCAREAPAAAPLALVGAAQAESIAWLIVGGEGAGICAAGAARDEVLRASNTPPFFRFVSAGATPTSPASLGMTATGVRDGRAIVTGGTDAGGQVLTSVERFNLAGTIAPGDDAADGAYAALGALNTARTSHHAARLGTAVVLSGGVDTTGEPTDSIEVINLPYLAVTP